MRFPDFSLDAVGGGTVALGDLLGRPWIAYLARHPGWSICRVHLRRAAEARTAMQDVGADLVVFYNAKPDLLAGHTPPDALHVLADPRRTVYDPLGTTRMSKLALVTSQVGPGLKALTKGEVPQATRADMQRLGADVAVRADGEIALIHRATSPDDRLDPAKLIAAL